METCSDLVQLRNRFGSATSNRGIDAGVPSKRGPKLSSVSRGGIKVHACEQLRGFKSPPNKVLLQLHRPRTGGRGGTGRGPAEILIAETNVSFHGPANKFDEGLSRVKFAVS